MDVSPIRLFLLLLLLAFAPCRTSSQQPPAPEYAALLAADLSDRDRLHRLFDTYWKLRLEESPESATYFGYPGQNDRWTDWSLEAIDRRKRRLNDPLAVLDKIQRAKLSPEDQLNYDLFRRELTLDLEGSRFPGEFLRITQMGGVQQDIARTLRLAPRSTLKDYQDLLARLKAAPALIDENIRLLQKGLERGITPPRVTLRDVPQQIRNQIPASLQDSVFLEPFKNFPSTVPPAQQEQLRAEAEKTVALAIIPSFEELEAFFRDKYLPGAREPIALSQLPEGKDWYRFNVRRTTTTSLSPEEIHQIGLAEVARIRAEMDKIIKSTGFTGTFEEFTHFLRTDPQFFYTRAEDLISGYREIAKRADPELAKLFGKLPRLPYGVLPVPAYAEKSQTTAYYQPGAAAFGRAGYFFANTYNLASRPKWEMEALTLHEAMPGHHLQIALAQEMENVPDFRKHSYTTAFVEGWGLYSEKLGEEMGFYTDPYSKFGQLTYEMWRAIRLVVDTGMHWLGWSREKAIAFFKENSAKTEHDITVEIDRYIVWPGQALAYKIGELKIKELRATAERELGPAFDVRQFHDELLKEGAIPLDVLETRMNAWLKAQKAQRKAVKSP